MIKILNKVLLFLTLLFSINQAQSVVINEMMSSNSQTIADEDGEYSDWLEFYNPLQTPVDLTGCGLSDNASDLYRWIFPSVIIQPNQFLLVYASAKNRKVWANHWETVIDQGDTWRYRVNDSAPPSNWYQSGFNDSGWLEGPSGFGYGDNDDATTVPAVMSVYVRKKFTITDLNNITAAMLHVDYDDGFVAYLNGFEIARSNLGTVGVIPAYDLAADTYREALIYQGGLPDVYDTLSIYNHLVAGENLLAIEIHNSGSGSTDLSLIPFFTLGMKIAPANPHGIPEILRFSLPNLHTNFKLSAVGETIYLTAAQGMVLDSVYTGEIPQDVSWGRQADGSSNWYLFPSPTPGTANNTTGYMATVPGPVFSLPAGFYPEAQNLDLSSIIAGGVIHFTLDGSVPDSISPTYTNPISIDNNTVVRARFFKSGYLPSITVTHSYFINENQNLPVISLVSTPANFWDNDSGIYVKGDSAEPDFPYFGANFWQDWERPVHVELFESGGVLGFSIDAGIQINGGWNRGFDQKSLAVYARKKYGADRIAYQLFPGLPINEFQSFVLRNSGNDWNYAFMRDVLITDLINDRGLDMQAYRPVVVYINGAYWGIHDLREKISEHFLAAHHGVNGDNLDILQNNMEVVQGDAANYQSMLNFLGSTDISDSSNYATLQQMMNVNNFINYELAQIYCDNTDWPGNNIKYWREKTFGSIWRWIMYDMDFGFGLYDADGVSAASFNTLEFATAVDGPDWPNPPWSTFLLRKLLENEKFKQAFINCAADLLNLNFESNRVIDRINYLKSLVQVEMVRHQSRWGLSYTNWNSNVNFLEEFAQFRTGYMRLHLIQKFNLDGTARINLTASLGGTIKINSIMVDSFPWAGIYFRGVPLTLYAQPRYSYIFTGWQGDIISDKPDLVITPDGEFNIEATFVQTGSPVVINEINYNSAVAFNVEDWIEIYNRTAGPVDLSNWQFRDSDELHSFIFPAGTIIQSDSYLVLCRDTLLFRQGFPNTFNLLGDLGFGLSGAGELICLLNAQNAIVDSLTYTDHAPWPAAADGNGPTLQLKNPDLDNSLAENWAVSANYGTPGQKNDVYIDKMEQEVSLLPRRFELAQNYPNPFNPRTTINFELAVGGTVRLDLYNIQGQHVCRLIDAHMSAGRHRVEWEADHKLASGIYLYHLEVNNQFQATKKMILLR